jgi:hypothetical protein
VSYSANLPFPSLHHSYNQEGDCDYIEVGLCEGESADLMMFRPLDSTLPSAVLGRRGISVKESSVFGLKEISVVDLK